MGVLDVMFLLAQFYLCGYCENMLPYRQQEYYTATKKFIFLFKWTTTATSQSVVL